MIYFSSTPRLLICFRVTQSPYPPSPHFFVLKESANFFMDVPLDTGSRCRCKLSPENPTVLTTVTPPVGEELLGGEHFS